MTDEQEEEFERLLEAFQQAEEQGDVDETEMLAFQSLSLIRQAAEEDEETDERQQWITKAQDHENAAEWDRAEAAYRHALALAEQEGAAAHVFKAHDHLSSLYALRGLTEPALEEARAALEAARQTDLIPITAMGLLGLAYRSHEKGDFVAVAEAAEELLQISPPERLYDLQRARALVLRARCHIEQEDTATAQIDLEAAWQLLSPKEEAVVFAGFQTGFAAWWEATARLRSLENDTTRSATALSNAVGFRRVVCEQLGGPYSNYALAKTLQRYGDALQKADQSEAANQAFAESCALQQRIGIL